MSKKIGKPVEILARMEIDPSMISVLRKEGKNEQDKES